MGIGDALRRLDDRVLGPPAPASTATHRNIFLVGLVGTLAVLVVVVVTGEGAGFAGVGGFVALMTGGGVRWTRVRRRERRDHRGRPPSHRGGTSQEQDEPGSRAVS